MIDGTGIEDRVWISSIAKRVSEQAADPQLFVRRPTDVRDRSCVAIIIVRTRVVRVDPACANRIIKAPDLAVALAPPPESIVRSTFGGDHRPWRARALFGKNLDNPCQGTRSVQGTLRPAHNFDSINVVDGQIGEIKSPLQPLIDRDAVEQDLRVLAAQSPSEN